MHHSLERNRNTITIGFHVTIAENLQQSASTPTAQISSNLNTILAIERPVSFFIVKCNYDLTFSIILYYFPSLFSVSPLKSFRNRISRLS
jgi:hypothetical protein